MARKSKGFNELLQDARYEQNPQGSLEEFQKQVAQGPLKDSVKEVVITPEGQEKMSDVMTKFLKPYFQYADTYDAREKLVLLGMFAWNIGNLPENEHKAQIKKAAQVIETDDYQLQQDFIEILRDLVDRKKTVFNDNKRTVMDFKLTKGLRGFRLSVVSTLPQDADPQPESDTDA